MDESSERRHFTRVAFDASATVNRGLHRWETTVIDLSLKGILVNKDDKCTNVEDIDSVSIKLNDEVHIDMDVDWVHTTDHHVGYLCTNIDLESITHLRRLVELNIGDSDLLERELSQLG